LVSGPRSVTGTLITGLTRDEWIIVATFEDDAYELRQLTLTDGHNGSAYIWTNADEASPEDWDPARFEAQHLSTYVQRCLDWRRLYMARR